MKNLILISLLLLTSCTSTRYITPEGVEVEHITFLANEKVGELYFLKEPNSIHFEMGNVQLSPVDIFLYGVKIGRTNANSLPQE